MSVWRTVLKCDSEPNPKKTEIYRIKTEDGPTLTPIYTDYSFDGESKEVTVIKPHSTCKSGFPFHPVDPSLLGALQEKVKSNGGSAVKVYNEVRKSVATIIIILRFIKGVFGSTH